MWHTGIILVKDIILHILNMQPINGLWLFIEVFGGQQIQQDIETFYDKSGITDQIEHTITINSGFIQIFQYAYGIGN